mgnify:CR=1 FL=1
MVLKRIQKIFLIFCASCFLLFAIFLPSILAIELEVSYPVIAGNSLTQSSTLPDYVLYIFNFGVLAGFFAAFLSLIWAGVLYFLSPVSVDLRKDAKDRVYGAISGIVILSLTYLIITTINPQLSVLNIGKLPKEDIVFEEKKSPGVYFFTNNNCSTSGKSYVSSQKDLGDYLRNKVNSAKIVHDPDSNTYYISVLYDTIDFQGKCFYVNPNTSCQSLKSFSNLAASASIYKYDFKPSGDGVYFYRRSAFNGSGGYYKVENSEIKGIYKAYLEDLEFNDVPKAEQTCIKYDEDGECKKRENPNLSGDNIVSIRINGNYIVLLIYYNKEKDSPAGPYSYCQAFPTQEDTNKFGPQQIKWEAIRSKTGFTPNAVVIIPVKEK